MQERISTPWTWAEDLQSAKNMVSIGKSMVQRRVGNFVTPHVAYIEKKYNFTSSVKSTFFYLKKEEMTLKVDFFVVSAKNKQKQL